MPGVRHREAFTVVLAAVLVTAVLLLLIGFFHGRG